MVDDLSFVNSKDIDYDFQQRFCEQYEVPSNFWSESCEELNGFFGSSTSPFVNGKLEKHRRPLTHQCNIPKFMTDHYHRKLVQSNSQAFRPWGR